jgi:hypothetical protein
MKVQIDKAVIECALSLLTSAHVSTELIWPRQNCADILRAALAAAQAVEPEHVAWPCEMIEGDFSNDQVILQMKCSEYKLSSGLHFLSKTRPAPAKPLSDEQYTEIAHGTASRYTHRTDPQFVAYTFLPHTLKDFVRKIEAAHGIKETS